MLNVGELAPEFELRDSLGVAQRLSEMASKGPAVLLFYRGYW